MVTVELRLILSVGFVSVHCGYLYYLVLACWAALVAGRALPTDIIYPIGHDMQSIINDLQAALMNYRGTINMSHLRHLPDLPCTQAVAHMKQTSTVAHKLSEYQTCVQQVQSFLDDSTWCQVVTLNQDLLQHLGSVQEAAGCPASSSSSPPSDFNTLNESIRCVDCWSQQVAALRR